MPAVLAEPEYATVIGMIFYGHRARMARGMHGDGWSSKLKAMLVGKGAYVEQVSANFASPLRTLRLRVFNRRMRQGSAKRQRKRRRAVGKGQISRRTLRVLCELCG